MNTQHLTKEVWIKRFRVTHGDKYDYSKFEYFNSKTKSEIICKVHGSFKQKPNNHKNGRGCPTCQSIFNQQGRDKFEILIEEGTRIHGGRYDYTKSTYNGALKNTTITCLIHGDFEQTPQSHVVVKNGCPECAGLKRRATRIANAGINFPIKAGRVHGYLYDYSLVQYSGAHNDVKIICEEHGEFTQSATNHLSGKGCQKCKGGVPIKLHDWLKLASEIHGNKYDYSQVSFKSVSEIVNISCMEHGKFEQRAFLHLKSLEPCPECRPTKPWTVDRFLKCSHDIHDGYYRYLNLPDEIDYFTPIQATCPAHGPWTIPYAGGHASGSKPSGCPECGLVKSGLARRITLEKVQAKFENNFPGKYNIEEIIFTNPDTPVKFTCPIHGSVSVRVANLFVGDGCFDCEEVVRNKERLLETKKFVAQCEETHQNYYDYSKTIYRNVYSKIWVICPKHGRFKQTAVTHRKGGGCSSCANYGFDPLAKCIFYYAKINRLNSDPLWMIGITKNSFERRYTMDERTNMQLIKTIEFDTGSEALLFETELKQKYQKYRFRGTSPLNVKLNTELFIKDILYQGDSAVGS